MFLSFVAALGVFADCYLCPSPLIMLKDLIPFYLVCRVLIIHGSRQCTAFRYHTPHSAPTHLVPVQHKDRQISCWCLPGGILPSVQEHHFAHLCFPRDALKPFRFSCAGLLPDKFYLAHIYAIDVPVSARVIPRSTSCWVPS